MAFFKDTILYKRLLQIKKLKRDTVFNIVYKKANITNLIIKLNTQKQLLEQGVDSNNKDLKSIGGDYSFVTKSIKNFDNKPFDHITLNDTGDFYKTFLVRIVGGNIVIYADTIKDDDDLTDRWGDDILGLNEESKLELINFSKSYFIQETRKQIWK